MGNANDRYDFDKDEDDFLENYTAPTSYIPPTSDDYLLLANALGDDIGSSSSSSTSLRRIPAPGNSFFGRYKIHQIDDDEIGDVPVYNVAIDADVTSDNVTFEQVIDWCFKKAYSFICSRTGRRENTAYDYAEIRLLRVAGGITESLTYDLNSSMVPVNEAVDDFINLYLLMIQSDTNKTLDTMNQLFEFRITFVLHNQTTKSSVNSSNIGPITAFARKEASNVKNKQTSILATRARYLAQNTQQNRRSSINPQNPNVLGAYRENKRLLEATLSQNVKELRKVDAAAAIASYNSAAAVPAVKKKKAPTKPKIRVPLTEAKKEEYRNNRNIKRAADRLALPGPHGVYDDLKKKLFHHTSLNQFFRCSKAVMEVKTTWDEGFCLALAFMRSEMRTYCFGENGDEGCNLLEIIESKPLVSVCTDAQRENYRLCPILQNSKERLMGQIEPFISEGNIVLFNPHKKVQSRIDGSNSDLAFSKYDVEMSQNEIQNWYSAGKNVHEFVCRSTGLELDPNSEDSLQYYSDIFDVYICVYRMEVPGKRTNIYRPSRHGNDIRKEENSKICVVSILLENLHATAITSLREFLKTNVSANRSTLYGYCLFCEKNATGNNETIAESKKHYKKCLDKCKGLLTCEGDSKIRQRQLSDIHPSPFNFRKGICFCKLCSMEVVGGVTKQMHHECFINKPKDLKLGENQDIYVYDMECAQIKEEGEDNTGIYIHEVNLVCVRRAYPDANGDCDRNCFPNIQTFVEYVMLQKQTNRIYIAHNGSKYDVQFVMRYLETNLIAHTFVPSPSSMHAYLSVTISFGAKIGATFIDFRHFMPGSLKNIGISFGLSVAKGDFPHHFNNGFNDYYEGAIPSNHHDDDYWCMATKRTQEDIDSFEEFYATECLIYCCCDGDMCSCSKLKWNFMEQITKYCWLDVDVLAEACVKYRNNALEFGTDEETNEGWQSKGIDPFQYLTIPQLALNLLLGGSPEEEKISITISKNRRERIVLAIAWMERMSEQLGVKVYHAGNHNREYFCETTKRYVDGVSDEGHVFICLNCEFHGCNRCFHEENQTGIDHPFRPGAYNNVTDDTEKFVQKCLKHYGSQKTYIVWEHELDECGYNDYEHKLGEVMKERDMFYGGRTEVFSPYVNMDLYPNDELKYHDVCSLYPYVCAFKPLPTGQPEHLFGRSIDRNRLHPLHPNRYFGFVRCKVRPNNKDLIGLLPFRDPDSGRLEFPLREMTGSWGTEELQLAIEHGYEVLEVYEVYHWSKEERSDTLLRGYVSFFLRMKQEAEGWKKLGASSDDPDEEEQERVKEKVFLENGSIAMIRNEKVGKNPVKRQMAKLFLNSLWGKFCQKPHSENYIVIHGYKQFADLWYNRNLDRSKFSFRHLSGNTWKVKYCTIDEFTRPNPKYNIYLSSKVTEWARCILHRQMKKIGEERILYCDTDSIMFLHPKGVPKQDGCGLGNWVDEYPSKTIRKLFALAPKFYYLEFQGDQEENLLKSKGIQMTLANNKLIHSESLGRQLMEKFFPRTIAGEIQPFEGYMHMKNMIMGVNSINARFAYGTMMTRHTEDKRLGPVFSKRQLVIYTKEENVDYNYNEMLALLARMYSIPKGYYKSVHDVSMDSYEYL